MRYLLAIAVLLASAAYGAVSFEDGVFSLYRSGRLQSPTYATYAECRDAIATRAAAEPKTSGYLTWACRQNVVARYSPDPIPLAAPSSFTAVASGNAIRVSWSAVPGAGSYQVERCTGVGCVNFSQLWCETTTARSNTSLPAGTTYRYRARASRAADCSGDFGPYSDATATTEAAGVSLRWSQPASEDPITSYLIVWGAVADQLHNSVQIAPALAYTLPLPAGAYYIAVVVQAGGNRAQSNVVRVTVPSEQTVAITWPSTGGELFRDDFRSGDRSHTENGIAWVGSHNTSVVRDPGNASGYALQFHYSNPASGSSFAEQRFRLGQVYTELWIKLRLVIPANFQHPDGPSSDNNKFLRLWSGTYSTYTIKNGYSLMPENNAAGESQLIFEFGKTKSDGSLSGVGQFGSYRAPVRRFIASSDYGKEVEFVMQFKVDTAGPSGTQQPSYLGGNGVQRVWKNGVLVAELTTISNNPGRGTNGWTDGYFLGADNSDYHGGTESTIFLAREVAFAKSNIWR